MPQFGGLTYATVARNTNNQLVAYIADANQVSAISLGTSSGSVMWTSSSSAIGTSSIPTIVGNSIVLAGPDQYYAFDQLTGAANHFFSGSTNGGGGVTVAFDSQRMQFYIHDSSRDVLEAYSYTSNSTINSLWQVANASSGGSVSIGPDGGIYYATTGGLFERDPVDGHLLNSITGLKLSNYTTPALSANSIFVYGDATIDGTTEIFNLNTFAHVASIQRGRTDKNTPFQGPGAVFDNGYVLSYESNLIGSFEVYWAVPEPSTLVLSVGIFALLATRRRRRG